MGKYHPLSVLGSTVQVMRNLRLSTALIGLSIFALLLLRYLPEPWRDDEYFANSIFSYVVLGSIFYFAVYFLGLPSLEYFRLPRLHYMTLVAVLVALTFVTLEFKGTENPHLETWVAVGGAAFLLAIGFGEEMFSRAFTFGVLSKFPQQLEHCLRYPRRINVWQTGLGREYVGGFYSAFGERRSLYWIRASSDVDGSRDSSQLDLPIGAQVEISHTREINGECSVGRINSNA